jgi:small subunit ribosomal protein S17
MTSGKGEFGGRRVLEGTVVSDKMDKTVLVTVRSSGRHRLYKKIVRRVKRFMAHDDEFDAHTGDVVRIVESPPKSRKKRWQVVEVLFRADLPEVAAESIDLDLIGEVKTEEEDQGEAPASPVTDAGPEEAAASQPEALVDAAASAEETTTEVESPVEAEVPAEVETPAEVEVAAEVDAEGSEEAEEPSGEAESPTEATVSAEEESQDK